MANRAPLHGHLDLLLLKLLVDEGPMYGYAIDQRLRARTDDGIVVNEGALYSALHKL